MDAYRVYKKFGEVLKATKYSKLPGLERKYEADGQTKVALKYTEEQKRALIKNRMTVTALIMASWENEDQYCMNMVFNSKAAKWPSGQTWEIIQKLQDEFAPNNLMGDTEQQRELEAIYMKRNANPKIFL